jgi:hypothetical protein
MSAAEALRLLEMMYQALSNTAQLIEESHRLLQMPIRHAMLQNPIRLDTAPRALDADERRQKLVLRK